MGVSKAAAFTKHQNEIATMCKALSHPARIAIIEYLLSVNSCICSDIVGELPLAQPTVSQHLKALKNANIIQGTIDGTAICYCLNQNMIQKFKDYFAVFSLQLESKCC